jgi:hypothetical protein
VKNTWWCMWFTGHSCVREILLLHENFQQWIEYIYVDIFNKEEVWNIWMDSNNFQHEVGNHRNRKVKYLWLDHGGNIWITSFSEHLRELWNFSTTHISWSIIVMMEYPRDVSKPCWVNDEIKYWMPLYFCGLCFSDYRFYIK